MKKRLVEAGTIAVDPETKTFRVCLLQEGRGSSADYPREFFTPENAIGLAGSLSFPGHPADVTRPELRDPLGAIGQIADEVTIEEHNGRMGFWSEFTPAQSKPEVGAYLSEFSDRLGLSVYVEFDGRKDASSGRWIAEHIIGSDPYRSVDLVVAAGAGGKFERAAESLRRFVEASATAEGKEESLMEIKDVENVVNAALAPLTKIVESLAATIQGNAQVEVDATAVEKAVEARIGDYDKAVGLIIEAKLTESQSEMLLELARSNAGVDIAAHVEKAKKVLAEARAGAGDAGANHLGGGTYGSDKGFDIDVPSFGRMV